jgi:hypothetical protein
VGEAGAEVPQITTADVVDEVAALRVDGCDASAAGKHEGPFGFAVPVQFAVGAGFQSHVDTGQGGGNRQFAHGDFAGPPTGQEAIVRSGEGEL